MYSCGGREKTEFQNECCDSDKSVGCDECCDYEECCDCDKCFDCDECCNCDEFLTKFHLIQPQPPPLPPPPSPRPPPFPLPARQTSLDLIRSGQFLSAFNRLAALNENTAYRRLV